MPYRFGACQMLNDLQVTDEDAYVVLNAGCRDKDIEHIRGQLKKFQVRKSLQSLTKTKATVHTQFITIIGHADTP